MSVIFTCSDGWIIDQYELLNKSYSSVLNNGTYISYEVNRDLFNITSQFLRPEQIQKEINLKNHVKIHTVRHRKRRRPMEPENHDGFRNTINLIKTTFSTVINESKLLHLFQTNHLNDHNHSAKKISKLFYEQTSKIQIINCSGGNNSSNYIVSEIDGESFIIPPNSMFYCFDVRQMKSRIELENQFDLILLDPPWWNKFIRRKKSRSVEDSYQMLYNEELADMPISSLMTPNAIIVIWCTNSKSHLQAVENILFPKWGIKLVAKWFWVKVTKTGDPICDFSSPGGKQPFEHILIGRNIISNPTAITIPENKVIVSIPSSIHSHKPNLSELLKPYLQDNPNCLEVFARSLQADWVSYGLEAIRLQHCSIFHEKAILTDG